MEVSWFPRVALFCSIWLITAIYIANMHNVFRAASILDFSTLIMYHVCSAAIHAHLSSGYSNVFIRTSTKRRAPGDKFVYQRLPCLCESLGCGDQWKAMLVCKPTNLQDQTAVAVKKDWQIIGHNTKMTFFSHVSLFLSRPSNSGCVEVTGIKIKRGVGYGLELLCVYHFHGPVRYLTRIKELLNGLKE